MQEFITPYKELLEELQSYQDFLDCPLESDIATEIMQYGDKISEIMSRSGKLRSDAKYHLQDSKNRQIIKDLDKLTEDFGMSKTMQKEMVESACGDYISTYEWADRVNRTATHQLEWCRSKLSFIKEEMNASRGMNNQNNRRS